ncbi:MAG: tetratricopeptide repeat protein, partial [Candidatus Edwardsbacteria bacterium]|nr:tetratricopeptide repeat protein [Candidatus Edwardsbacteria bacterium]
CNLYYQFSLWEKMDPVRDRLLTIAREANYRPGIAQGLYFTGLETINGGDYRRAIDIYLQALSVEHDETDAALTGEIYNDVGFCYRRMSDMDKAEDYYRRSLAVRENTGNLLGQAESLSNLGFLKLFQGQPEQAESLLMRAHQLEARIGDRIGAGYTLVNLGYLAYLRAEFAKAREYHQRALELRLKLNDPLGQGHCYLQLRALAEIEDNGGELLRLINAAYHAFVRAGDATGQMECKINYAGHWLQQDRADVAGRILSKLEPLVREHSIQEIQRRFYDFYIRISILKNERNRVQHYWKAYQRAYPGFHDSYIGLPVQARVLKFLGDRKRARVALIRGLDDARSKRYPYESAVLLYQLAQVDAGRGRELMMQTLEQFRCMGATRMARETEAYLNRTDFEYDRSDRN